MLAFRSEGEVRRWCEAHEVPVSAIFASHQLWTLAKSWYDDRLEPRWQRRSVEERQLLLGEAGLSGDFWTIERS